MATTTPGGVIRGYWAIGREASAMPPTSVMTALSTVAKIGRSIKKRESIADRPSLFRPRSAGVPPAQAAGGMPALLAVITLPGGRGFRRRLPQRRHGPLL